MMATNESITDIQRAVRALAAMSEALPAPAQREIRRLVAALDELGLGLDDSEPSPAPPRTTTEALKQGLELAPNRRRHDAKAVPRGFDFEDQTFLARQEAEPEPSRAEVNVARSVAGTLALWLRERGGKGPLRPPARAGRKLAEPAIRKALGTLYEAIFGAPPGEDWRRHLSRALEHDVLTRERDRLRAEHGWPRGRYAVIESSEPAPADGYVMIERSDPDQVIDGELEVADELEHARGPDEILAYVREMTVGAVPPELTVAVIGEALQQTTLGGGKGGRTSAGWVKAFAERIAKENGR
ncbi:MAG: hypothetical protein IT348_20025 [Candidatus Eisenbacteria bacterium]|nr:hypothetical protein [Candidatus Eisenbacteria bacterium]